MSTTMMKTPRWWNEPMVWLIIALPLTAVVAGIITVVIAARNADTLVQGDYRKEGMAYHQLTDRDQRARELGLVASIQFLEGGLQIELTGQLMPMPEQLSLSLTHATLPERDVTLSLSHLGRNLYAAEVPNLRGANWQILLEPFDQSWRLAGRWNDAMGTMLLLNAADTDSSTRP